MRQVILCALLCCPAVALKIVRSKQGNTSLPTHQIKMARLRSDMNETSKSEEGRSKTMKQCTKTELGCANLSPSMLSSCCSYCPFSPSCFTFFQQNGAPAVIQYFPEIDNRCFEEPLRSMKIGQCTSHPHEGALMAGDALKMNRCYATEHTPHRVHNGAAVRCRCSGNQLQCLSFQHETCTGNSDEFWMSDLVNTYAGSPTSNQCFSQNADSWAWPYQKQGKMWVSTNIRLPYNANYPQNNEMCKEY